MHFAIEKKKPVRRDSFMCLAGQVFVSFTNAIVGESAHVRRRDAHDDHRDRASLALEEGSAAVHADVRGCGERARDERARARQASKRALSRSHFLSDLCPSKEQGDRWRERPCATTGRTR